MNSKPVIVARRIRKIGIPQQLALASVHQSTVTEGRLIIRAILALKYKG